MILTAVIEMPSGSIYKYEIDKDSGGLRIDRTLDIDVPYNYGFVPDTLCDDGDPLDVFVISGIPIYPKTHVKVRIVAGFKCLDGGKQDDKLIGLIEGMYPLNDDLEDDIDAIEFYLRNYKKGFQVLGRLDLNGAKDVYTESRLKNEQNS